MGRRAVPIVHARDVVFKKSVPQAAAAYAVLAVELGDVAPDQVIFAGKTDAGPVGPRDLVILDQAMIRSSIQ